MERSWNSLTRSARMNLAWTVSKEKLAPKKKRRESLHSTCWARAMDVHLFAFQWRLGEERALYCTSLDAYFRVVSNSCDLAFVTLSGHLSKVKSRLFHTFLTLLFKKYLKPFQVQASKNRIIQIDGNKFSPKTQRATIALFEVSSIRGSLQQAQYVFMFKVEAPFCLNAERSHG